GGETVRPDLLWQIEFDSPSAPIFLQLSGKTKPLLQQLVQAAKQSFLRSHRNSRKHHLVERNVKGFRFFHPAKPSGPIRQLISDSMAKKLFKEWNSLR